MWLNAAMRGMLIEVSNILVDGVKICPLLSFAQWSLASEVTLSNNNGPKSGLFDNTKSS